MATIAGKVFLLGEYAVLAGGPAIVATLGPRFACRAGGAGDAFHPRSPAGRLEAWLRERGVESPSLGFVDPYHGAGGFGASTAQFALLYAAACERDLALDRSALGARSLYIELLSAGGDLGFPPSGADLVAQWSGGVVCFEPAAGPRGSVSQVEDSWGFRDLLVFSATARQAGRKVATHEHLAGLAGRVARGEEGGALLAPGSSFVRRLTEVTRAALAAASSRGANGLGQAFTRYADLLQEAGLEAPAALEDRRALAGLPGVVGVKGAGAMLADSVVAMLEPGLPAEGRARVLEVARSRGLELAADGLRPEGGIQWGAQ